MAQAKGARKILYLGEDRSYWETIKARFNQTYEKLEFEFIKLDVPDYKFYQKNFLKIIDLLPDLIYIDFSQNTDYQLNLAHLIARENATKHIPMVGLVESVGSVKKGLTAGADFIHVKCGEYHDVIFDPFYLAFPKEAKKKDFATAKFSEEVRLIDDFRIGYIAPTYIHAEGNIELTKGQVIHLESKIPSKMVPSKKFVVKSIGDSNLYYDYKYSYDLEFIFVDEPEQDEGDELDNLPSDPAERKKAIKQVKDKRKQQLENYKEELRISKKKTEKWVEENIDLAALKKTKILIVDNKLRVLKDEKPIDDFPYSIRTQSYLTDSLHELNMFHPDIIAFQFRGEEIFDHGPIAEEEIEEAVEGEEQEASEAEELSPEEIEARKIAIAEAETEDMELLTNIIKYIKKDGKYKPFLILFNCQKFSSKAFQDSFKYPLVLTNNDNMNLPIIINMAGIYEKKQEKSFEDKVQKKIVDLRSKDPSKYRNLNISDFRDKHYYIKKTSPLSHISYSYPIELISLSESEVTFLAEAELDLKSFRMEFPLPMAIHLVPNKEGKKYEKSDGGRKLYKALIHSTDEVDKKELRQYVNEIFFTPLMEERAKEEEAFKEVREKALQAKAEEEAASQAGEGESLDDDDSESSGGSEGAPIGGGSEGAPIE